MPTTIPLFTILNSVDSTNNYAMAKVHAGLAKHGNAYYCGIQTEGKGQRGKNWHTGKDENIALSIVTQPTQLLVTEQFKLSAAVALASIEFFSSYAGDQVKIKWPNDIYWNDKKAGGILIENVIGKGLKNDLLPITENVKNLWKFAIIGIGININQTIFDESLKNIVSLKQITGKDFDTVKLAKELHLKVLKNLEEFTTTPFDIILEKYNEHLFKRDRVVKLKKDNIVFETVVKEVTASGILITEDSEKRSFSFGEVEWIL